MRRFKEKPKGEELEILENMSVNLVDFARGISPSRIEYRIIKKLGSEAK